MITVVSARYRRRCCRSKSTLCLLTVAAVLCNKSGECWVLPSRYWSSSSGCNFCQRTCVARWSTSRDKNGAYDPYYADGRSKSGRQGTDDDRDDADGMYGNQQSNRRPPPRRQRPAPSARVQYQDEDDYYDDPDDDYYNDDLRTYDEESQFAEDNRLSWETITTDTAGTCHVLLPPPSVTQPTCIVHFCGGTFFGSAPTTWYGAFLQQLVQHVSCVVVASTVPVTIRTSPLQHVRLAHQLDQQLRAAYEQVLLDEYGGDSEEDDGDLRNIPLCGLGHSLGARLLTVLATLQNPDEPADDGNAPSRRRRGHRSRDSLPPPYKAMVLCSFTNYGAAAGIPGLYQLGQARQNVERQRQAADAARGTRQPRSQRGGNRPDPLDAYNDYIDDDDDDNESWSTIWHDLQTTFARQAWRLRSAWTPQARDLEFYPTPEQLWRAIPERYHIPHTLVVQFDQDVVDQSSRLAGTLAATESNAAAGAAHETGHINATLPDAPMATNVHFCRLRGTHLTPVALGGGGGQDEGTLPTAAASVPLATTNGVYDQVSRVLLRLVRGKQQASDDNDSLRDLRQSIARYISEIVTK